MCYLMTTFRCPSDILITSRLFTARWMKIWKLALTRTPDSITEVNFRGADISRGLTPHIVTSQRRNKHAQATKTNTSPAVVITLARDQWHLAKCARRGGTAPSPLKRRSDGVNKVGRFVLSTTQTVAMFKKRAWARYSKCPNLRETNIIPLQSVIVAEGSPETVRSSPPFWRCSPLRRTCNPNFHISYFRRKSILVHFSVKIWHLVATILMIFLRINWSNLVHFKK